MCMHSAFCKRFQLRNHAFWRVQITISKYWGPCALLADLPTRKQQLQALNLLVILLPEANRDTLKVRIVNIIFLPKYFVCFCESTVMNAVVFLTFFFFQFKVNAETGDSFFPPHVSHNFGREKKKLRALIPPKWLLRMWLEIFPGDCNSNLPVSNLFS